MRVAVAADHGGYALKDSIVSTLERAGHEVIDCGTDSDESVDYPVFAGRAAQLVADGKAELGVLACGSGAGVAIVANKFAGVRAVNAADAEAAALAREHNDANVLCLAGRRLAPDAAVTIVESFLRSEFEGGRHARRVEQISEIEQGRLPSAVDEPVNK